MTDIPPQWVTAAMKGGALTDPFLSDRVKVKILLEGAAPLIAAAAVAAEREKTGRSP